MGGNESMPRTEDEEIEGRKSKTDAQGMGAGVEWHKGGAAVLWVRERAAGGPEKEIFLCFSPCTLEVMWQEGGGGGRGKYRD